MSKHIVSIHAHPDDAEILAAGTLTILTARGHRVTIVTMTPGDKGSMTLAPEEISKVRRKEASRAAAMIGADYLCAEFRDLAIFNDDASRRRMVELIRRLKPDIVLTSSPADYLCDHEATSMLVRDALFAVPAPNYRTLDNSPAKHLAAIPHLYFMDAIGGADREGRPVMPDFIVDVSSTFETKRKMLAAHESQRSWLSTQHNMNNYLDTMESWTKTCGRRAGIEYGEGFRHYKGHPYPQDPVLEEALGTSVRPVAVT